MKPERITVEVQTDASGMARMLDKARAQKATLEPVGPSGSLRCDGVVGPLSREEVLTLKIAEHVLCRDQLALAVASLLRGARKAGKSGVQKLVLAADLEELERRMKQADSVKWPNGAAQTRRTRLSKTMNPSENQPASSPLSVAAGFGNECREIPADAKTCRDPHHGGSDKWSFFDGSFWVQSLGHGKWVRVKKFGATPQRVSALFSLLPNQ